MFQYCKAKVSINAWTTFLVEFHFALFRKTNFMYSEVYLMFPLCVTRLIIDVMFLQYIGLLYEVSQFKLLHI